MRLHLERMIRVATQVGLSTASTLGLATCLAMTSPVETISPQAGNAPAQAKSGPREVTEPAKKPAVKLGLHLHDPKAFPGYTLISTKAKGNYLIDMEGRVAHKWLPETNSHHCCYLLENGHLLRPAELGGPERAFGGGPAPLGRIQEFTWEGDIVWDFKFYNDKQLPHHDIARMPNGNVLMVVWDKKTADEAIAAGRKKELVSNYVLPDSVVEIKPTGKTTGDVVWEWHLWDHLVQDHDASKPNYGKIERSSRAGRHQLRRGAHGPGRSQEGRCGQEGRRREG